KTRNALFSNMSDFETSGDDGDFDLPETYSLTDSSQLVESAEDSTRRAQILREIETEIQQLPGRQREALLGGYGRGRNGGCDGLLGRQRQDALLARGPGPQQGAEGKGNTTMTNQPTIQSQQEADRFGRRLAARLTAGTAELPYAITERLRAARVQAVDRRNAANLVRATSFFASGGAATLAFGDNGVSWWNRIASVLPLIVLAGGLILIHAVQDDRRASEVA